MESRIFQNRVVVGLSCRIWKLEIHRVSDACLTVAQPELQPRKASMTGGVIVGEGLIILGLRIEDPVK